MAFSGPAVGLMFIFRPQKFGRYSMYGRQTRESTSDEPEMKTAEGRVQSVERAATGVVQGFGTGFRFSCLRFGNYSK